jgi:hypothetical protein
MMSRAEVGPGTKIYTCKVTLQASDPPIWRRFQIPADVTLGDLHYTLQIVMGWTNSHLHMFEIGRERYTAVYPDVFDDDEPLNEEEDVELREVIKRKGAKLRYEYDFGDSWFHELRLEDVSAAQPGVRYPRCLEGERACPPEDCGGMHGYYRMLDILKHPEHKEYETYREWLPEAFDPDLFDLELANAELKNVSLWRRMADGDDEDSGDAYQTAYNEPVARLLTLGEPQPDVNYTELGLGPEHIGELIELAMDTELRNLDADGAEVWGPIHAWRALGELRAEEAVEPLVELLRLLDDPNDDWANEIIPDALSLIGPAAIPAVAHYLQDSAGGLWGRIGASEALADIARDFPESRGACVAIQTAQLERFAESDADLNAFLVYGLVRLKAVESAPVIERAYAAGAVAWSLLGDWEEAQIALGLLDKRVTPRPARWFMPEGSERPQRVAPPPPAAAKKREKTKKKRQTEKKSRKKNRRK